MKKVGRIGRKSCWNCQNQSDILYTSFFKAKHTRMDFSSNTGGCIYGRHQAWARKTKSPADSPLNVPLVIRPSPKCRQGL